MAVITIDLDATAWFPQDTSTTTSSLTACPMAGARHWQNVARDEMCIGTVTYPSTLTTADVDGVRERFRELLQPLRAALIDCDIVDYGGTPAIRTIAKYRPAKGFAMTYVGALTVPVAPYIIELSIQAVERGTTGVREALVTSELIQTAGISELEQLARNIIPIEWKFERYHPGSHADVSYLSSDDARYDEKYPDHPLSRVRRGMRRLERTFRVTVNDPEAPGLCATLRQPEVRPVRSDEVVRELGYCAFADAMLVEAARANGVIDVPLETRQKVADETIERSVQKTIEESRKRPAAEARHLFNQPWSEAEVTRTMAGIYDTVLGNWRHSPDPRWRDLATLAQANKDSVPKSRDATPAGCSVMSKNCVDGEIG